MSFGRRSLLFVALASLAVLLPAIARGDQIIQLVPGTAVLLSNSSSGGGSAPSRIVGSEDTPAGSERRALDGMRLIRQSARAGSTDRSIACDSLRFGCQTG